MRKTIVLASAVVLVTTLSAFSCHQDAPANNAASADAVVGNDADANLAVADANAATSDNAAVPEIDSLPPSPPPPPAMSAPTPGNPDNRRNH